MKKNSTKTIDNIKAEYERLRKQMTPEVQALFSLLFNLFEVLIFSLSQNKANSRNSHLPPSQDIHRKKSKRTGDSKRPGGQKGHAGVSLAMVTNPDKVIKHPALNCDDCGQSLANVSVDNISRHQVIDIEFTKIITEHRVEHKICNCGHHQYHANATGPVKYGNGLKAVAVELNQVQCVPFKRCTEFFQQKFSLSLSPATLISFIRQASARLLDWELSAKKELLSSPVLHADETGININTKTWWVHVLSSEQTTLMIPHKKRGSEGMIETEILPNYHGILSHDFWACYGNFDAVHAPCHSHLQRELTKVYEEYKQDWGKKLAKMLIEANEERNKADGNLSYDKIQYFEKEYSKIINHAKKINPSMKDRIGERGRIGQTYPRRLLNRLIKYRDWILIFLYDPMVPFTNNQAERDIRMLKVQQKVSGHFKTENGARDYCRIRSYILTMQKKGLNKHQALTNLFQGT